MADEDRWKSLRTAATYRYPQFPAAEYVTLGIKCRFRWCLLPRIWPAMLGTPGDLRPDIGRYLQDERRGRSVETSENFNPNYHCRITSLMLPERASHCTMTIGCQTSNKTSLNWSKSTPPVHGNIHIRRTMLHVKVWRKEIPSVPKIILNVPLENNSRMCRHHHWWRRVAKL